jgi:hypothetical protein
MNKWSRRGFIGAGVLTGGALVVGVAIRPGNAVDKLRGSVAGGEGEQLVNAWVKIDRDNTVTAIVGNTENSRWTVRNIARLRSLNALTCRVIARCRVASCAGDTATALRSYALRNETMTRTNSLAA